MPTLDLYDGFTHLLGSDQQNPVFPPYTLKDIFLGKVFPLRPDPLVILGHHHEDLVEIRLSDMRYLISKLSSKITERGLATGDTVMLTSFYSSNELYNAILFCVFACMGIRVFIPIYPEENEFTEWYQQTGFSCVFMPYRDTQDMSGHEQEKGVIQSIMNWCAVHEVPLLDPDQDLGCSALLGSLPFSTLLKEDSQVADTQLSPDNEAVIFTTSGSSGKSKLVVYTQGSFSLSCQAWEKAGLFKTDICGNTGFTPLFTHTIGIRSLVNAFWTGKPACILTTDWFFSKPEAARYLLLKMTPEHIIGGPALLTTLLEFFRIYPELKQVLCRSLKLFISIGTVFDVALASRIRSQFGLEVWNGFGTTETQMVLLNRCDNGIGAANDDLGEPMPGVVVGLKSSGTEGVYELYIHSCYQSSRIMGNKPNAYFIRTGDLVGYEENSGTLRYVSRQVNDFVKDDYGVKIPLKAMEGYYPLLKEIASYIEWIPLDSLPGFAALVFPREPESMGSVREICDWVRARNDELALSLEPFEYTHRHLERISVLKEKLPMTRKGTVSLHELRIRYGDLIRRLKNRFIQEEDIHELSVPDSSHMHRFGDQRLASMLEVLGLDKTYERGEGNLLFYSQMGGMQSVLDLVGGFGAALLGHGNPEIKQALLDFLSEGRPALNSQGSSYHYPSLLARELSVLFGSRTGRSFRVLLANTGAEAVEMALHHAYFAWWSLIEKMRDEQLRLYGSEPGIDVGMIWERNMQKVAAATACCIVVDRCFHGCSSGARSLLNHNKKQRNGFGGLLRVEPLHIRSAASEMVDMLVKFEEETKVSIEKLIIEDGELRIRNVGVSTIIAAFIEPVQGEGGIRETPAELISILTGKNYPLISDEIQCGLGRSGLLPSCNKADYYLLGKSLGGGYEKISAVLIEESQFKQGFSQYYTSTFANGEMAAYVALKTLQLIQREDVPAMALEKGNLFKSKLQAVAGRFPGIIKSVEGRGLMLGIHFNGSMGDRNPFLRILAENDLLGYVLSGWLFHNRHIRVLPSLSSPLSIRIEPSYEITEDQMDQCCSALDDMCCICYNQNIYELVRYIMDNDPYSDRKDVQVEGSFPKMIEKPAKGALRVGFIGNFTMPIKEFKILEPSLKKASDTGIRRLFSKMQALMEGKPIKIMSKNLMGGRVHFTFYILPFDTASLEMISRWGKRQFFIQRIQDAVGLLSSGGASHIALGAHTSILTGNGLMIAESGNCRILTGNTLAAASCLFYAEEYFDKLCQEKIGKITIAITGANGNIGAGLAGCMAHDKYRDTRLLMIGNNIRKLEKLREKLFVREREVACSTDLTSLREADMIVCCTNTNDPIVFSHHIHPSKKVFIIDIAVPGSVSEDVKSLPQVEFCSSASSIRLPDDPDLVISAQYPPGYIYCCAAEVILAAMNHIKLPLKGHIHPSAIRKLMQTAIKEGFFRRNSHEVLV